MDKAAKENVPVTTNKKALTKSYWPILQHPVLEMERAIDRLLGNRNWPSLSRWGDFQSLDNIFEFSDVRIPSLDVIDRENEIVVRAELPGIDKNDISVSLSDNLLTIKGESKREDEEEKANFYRHEISSSSYVRSVSVPANIEASEVVADLKNGVLEVKLPKTASSKRLNINVK